jgi:hypothetical protein
VYIDHIPGFPALLTGPGLTTCRQSASNTRM